MEEYNLIKVLGSGFFGTVGEYEDKRHEGNFVAIKTLNSNNDRNSIYNEIEAMLMLKGNENIVELLDWFEECNSESDSESDSEHKSVFFLVMELASCNLVSLRQQDREGMFNTDCVLFILRSMLKGLEYMHGKEVIHRDMHPGNVLISKQGVVKLADFGLAERRGEENPYKPSRICFTYVAPEIAENVYRQKFVPYDYKVDMWGVGCIVYEMILGKKLIDEIFPTEQNKWSNEHYGEIADREILGEELFDSNLGRFQDLPKLALTCAQRCLCRNPNLRPTAKRFLRMFSEDSFVAQLEKGQKVIKEILDDNFQSAKPTEDDLNTDPEIYDEAFADRESTDNNSAKTTGDDLTTGHHLTYDDAIPAISGWDKLRKRSESLNKTRQENVEFAEMKSEIMSLNRHVERLTDQLHATRKQVQLNSEQVSQTKEVFESETRRRIKEAQKKWSSRSNRSTSRERLQTTRRPSSR